jgi:excinuclease UvrABC ATPase subunit
VGTATDANAMLRILFSRLGQPQIGSPSAFSFNIPTTQTTGVRTSVTGERTVVENETYLGGMCPRCEGMGSVTDIALAQLYDDSKSLAEGAITIPGYTADGWVVRVFTESGFLDPAKPIRDFSADELNEFLYKEPTKVKINGINLTYEGLIPKIQKSMLSKDVEAMQPHIRAFVERAVTFTTCPECGGSRLSAAARSSKIAGISIADACAMQISDLAEWVRGLAEPTVAPLLASLQQSLDSFVEIGLGYLSLDRPAGTLSGGEAQRVKMIRHLGSSLTDVTYVFDEPTVGLHPHDIQRMNELLLRLRDKGNTVLVVEHKPETIAIGDHVVDLGPGAGSGGRRGDVRGHRRRAPSQRHADREAPRRPGIAAGCRAQARGCARGARRHLAQSAGGGCRHPARAACGRHRRGRLGQELVDPRVRGPARWRGRDRPGSHPGIPSQQPGDVHRAARPDPVGLRQGQRGEAGAVQCELRGGMPGLQRRGRDLHRPRRDGQRGVGVRGVRRQALPGRGARVPARRPRHRPGARDVGLRRRAVLRAGR